MRGVSNVTHAKVLHAHNLRHLANSQSVNGAIRLGEKQFGGESCEQIGLNSRWL